MDRPSIYLLVFVCLMELASVASFRFDTVIAFIAIVNNPTNSIYDICRNFAVNERLCIRNAYY